MGRYEGASVDGFVGCVLTCRDSWRLKMDGKEIAIRLVKTLKSEDELEALWEWDDSNPRMAEELGEIISVRSVELRQTT